ncbi:hypothetical protein RDI58_024320 [Solanum bulbocastanum]
MHVLQ